MKVSRTWLQEYFEQPLPSVAKIADAITFHSFEIEETEGEMLDVKILPDRAADCLSHRGIAREIGAVMDLPLAYDPLREELPTHPETSELTVSIENPEKCLRYMGAIVRGVKVGPSPAWLKEALESVGQRSINNVVDATNYVMLNVGQPLHAFDAAKLQKIDDAYSIAVRAAKTGEKITTLSGDEYTLPEGTLLITDAHADLPIGVAGVKGGKHAEIDASSTDLIIESANFEGTSVRKTAQALKLWTDASLRYQNRPSPELTAYGMRDVLTMITDIAGGEVTGVVDVYPNVPKIEAVSVEVAHINRLLGTDYTAEDVVRVFDRLGFSLKQNGDTFTVTPPFERRDITIAQNLIEEVGRVLGYEHIASQELPQGVAADQDRYHGIERIRDFMVERGFTEISTQSFAVAGDIYLANPLDQTKPALRTTLSENMTAALAHAVSVAPRVLGPDPFVKLFEIGNVFTNDGEHLSLCYGIQQVSGKKYPGAVSEAASALGDEFALHTSILTEHVGECDIEAISLSLLGRGYAPRTVSLGPYHGYSIYPFALRDIAVWTPEGTQESEVSLLIAQEADELLARIDRFDRFEKDGRTSYAFRLVFQASDRTLADTDLDPIMERVTNILNAQEGWEVR
ncbi:MAG: phenylalanyl-tRNA synthetase beta chain [Parcubacteria bacterium C7867-007]|nr:MAG: phenylalanyl-tRNA synthetase beta chain [Parcubacteria bacterium C7867-007]